jgi:hypothetical protein
LARGGFDPNGLERYIERIQDPSAKTDGYAVLPPRDERLAAMRAAIGQLGSAVPAAGSPVEFAAVQNEVRTLSQSPSPSEHVPSLKRNSPK